MTTVPSQTPKTSIWKVMIPVLGILAAVVIGLQLIKNQAASKPGSEKGTAQEIQVGSQVPDVKLARFGSTQTETLSQLFASSKAKIIMVNFWATWCEACMEEMPSLVKLYSAYHTQGFEIAAINVDDNPDAVVGPVLKKLKINFPIFLDAEKALVEIFDVHAIPLTAVVDSNRKILWMESGGQDWDSKAAHHLIEGWIKG